MLAFHAMKEELEKNGHSLHLLEKERILILRDLETGMTYGCDIEKIIGKSADDFVRDLKSSVKRVMCYEGKIH